MYALTYKGKVFLTPREWTPGWIKAVIKNDYNIDIPVRTSDKDNLPLEYTEDIKAWPVIEIRPDLHALTQVHSGPTWTFDENVATAEYEVIDRDLNMVRIEFKQKLAEERYKREVSGTKIVIQGMEVTVDTRRGERDVFVHAYLLMADMEIRQWKFPEGWLTISKAEMGQLVNAGAVHVQACFTWEEQVTNHLATLETHEQIRQYYDQTFPQAPLEVMP